MVVIHGSMQEGEDKTEDERTATVVSIIMGEIFVVVVAKVALGVTTGVAEGMVRGQHLWQWQELRQQGYGKGSDDNGCYNFSGGDNDGSDVGGVNKAAVVVEMAEKRDPGGGRVLQHIHSLFPTTYSIFGIHRQQ